LPAITDLPASIAALARQWPAGAYEAEGEAFHQHWLGRGHRRADWAALWASRVQARHDAVMRSAKAGVAYAAAGSVASQAAPPVERAITAKRREDARSAELHDALAEQLGQRLWEQWFAPAALIFDESGGLAVVAPTAFHRTQLETVHAAAIETALAALGRGVDWIRFITNGPQHRQRERREDRRVVEAGQNDWCILRTQSANTLGLAGPRRAAGAWTPTEVITRHARRAIPARLTVPLMPSLVFVGWVHLGEMIALARSTMAYRLGSGSAADGRAAFRISGCCKSVIAMPV
jgi:hypothetical protein